MLKLTSIYDCPWSGDYGPKIKRPPVPSDGDATLFAQFVTLLAANASLGVPVGDITWSDERHPNDIAEAERAMRALVATNPKLLRFDDRRETPTPAVYLVRQHDYYNLATIYFRKATP